MPATRSASGLCWARRYATAWSCVVPAGDQLLPIRPSISLLMALPRILGPKTWPAVLKSATTATRPIHLRSGRSSPQEPER